MKTKEETLKAALELNKELLRGIKTEEFLKADNEVLSEEELIERANAAEIFYKNYMEKVLEVLILQQLVYLGKAAENEYMLLFGRGTLNGLYEVRKWFQQQSGLSKSRFQESEELEKLEE